jgi:hypothetical protein
MSWVYLLGLGLTAWAGCGAVMAIGRRVLGLEKALRLHLALAPVIAFLASSLHKLLAPEFGTVLRAASITGLVILLDVAIVAPFLERSFAMFRSPIGTWLPFAAMFLASLAAGILVPG